MASILLGLIGYAANLFFNHRLEKAMADTGELGEIITFIKYGQSEKAMLFSVAFAGLVCGLIPSIKNRTWWTLIGPTICIYNIVELAL